MAMVVKLSNTTTQGNIAEAYKRLKGTTRIGGMWLNRGYRHDLSQPRGLRSFVPSREFIIQVHV